MKMVMLVFDAAYEEAVMETLSRVPVAGFTQWSRVLGRGMRSDPKMDTAVWPGFNQALVAALEDGAAATLTDALAELVRSAGGKGVKAFIWPLDRVI